MKAIKYIRIVSYVAVYIYISSAFAGSYEDFFSAVRRDDDVAIAALFKRGFDPNTRGPEGQSGLMLAMQVQSLRAAKSLLDHPAIEIDAVNAHGESALMFAALRGEMAWMEKLIERGARINLPGWSPLHYSATGHDPRIVALLLDRGADINADSPNRTTPLMMAARYGSEESVTLLLARGADPKRRNEHGLGAVDFARQAGRDSLAAKLEQLQR